MIVILTGAGISQESGIPTFRDSGGLWENYNIEDVATPTGFRKNPPLVQKFYNLRRAELLSGNIQPNPAHLALAKLEDKAKEEVYLVTQNVDDLHERAGSKNVVHMHGELLKSRCQNCGSIFIQKEDLSVESICSDCGAKGSLRPHVVWFGEMPLFMDEIHDALMRADTFIAIGTSGVVYPAAGFVRSTKAKRKIEINRENSSVSEFFTEKLTGKASEVVVSLVDSLLSTNQR
ncbi:MAG: NAD-dependent deacylase [Deltaproteobacteria bacterium]|jgi:NAD-dependent deacetylase|nr:NAD-dependent deacylase [Deltaproteobacteria bacterium]